jgi:8-amino-7-oxononanoate synthase
MSDKLSFIRKGLERRREEHRYRSLRDFKPQGNSIHLEFEGKTYVNFSGNDYLGLSAHPDVIKNAEDYLNKYGAGSAASRLITGNLDIHRKLEFELAKAVGAEATLIFNSGFQANTTILSTLADRHSLIIADRKVHNSLIQGIKLSGAEFRRFRHNDLLHLEELLEKAQKTDYSRVWVVSETVFSMDGDRSDTSKIAALCDKYNALFYSDDAHAIGVLGENGMGLNPLIRGIHLSVGTFGKSFGAFGAFAAGSREIIEYLINFAPGFIYTTALPPAVIGAISASLKLIPVMDTERELLQQRSNRIRSELKAMGYDTGRSQSQIIPVIIGSEQETMALSDRLLESGILSTAVRPPTVEEGASRIRLTLSAIHTESDIDRLLQAFKLFADER